MKVETWDARVKILLREKNISQADIASALGIQSSSANHKINGNRQYTTEEIVIIAGMLGISLDEMIIGNQSSATNSLEQEILATIRKYRAKEVAAEQDYYAANKLEQEALTVFRGLKTQEKRMILKMMKSLQLTTNEQG